MHDEVNEPTDAEEVAPYEPPTVTDLGTLAEVTLGTNPNAQSDVVISGGVSVGG